MMKICIITIEFYWIIFFEFVVGESTDISLYEDKYPLYRNVIKSLVDAIKKD